MLSGASSGGVPYEAAIVSIASGSDGGQKPEVFFTWLAATLMTTTKGPGVRGMWSSW